MKSLGVFPEAIAVAVLAACVTPAATTVPAPISPAPTSVRVTVPIGARGLVLPPGGGERFTYCARPLTLWITLDSVSAPTTQLVAGIGEIRGDEGLGRHRGRHEVVYIRSGWGYAVFGSDTSRVGPGSVIYVPPGTAHRFISTGEAPLEYFWVIGPLSSAAGFRNAAAVGCPGEPAPSAPPPSLQPPSDSSLPAVLMPPGAGERITYCDIPLVLTAKVDSENVAGTWLRAATGVLRRGSEAGVHQVDEVVLITHGRGRAFIGNDTAAVETGSVTHTPRGMPHGFINESNETLEYFIVYAGTGSREAFRRRAARPGPYCPDRLR